MVHIQGGLLVVDDSTLDKHYARKIELGGKRGQAGKRSGKRGHGKKGSELFRGTGKRGPNYL